MLRTYQNEVFAIRELVAVLIAAQNVVPVFEPINEGQIGNLIAIANAGLRILVIENPDRGPYEQSGLPASYVPVLAHPNIVPTLLVDSGTVPATVTLFHPGRSIAIVVQDTPSATVASAISTRAPIYGLFAPGLSPVGIVPRSNAVDIEDPFNRRRPNAAYLAHLDELYSGRYATISTDPDFAHFGDHSIQGDTLNAGGGRGANRAALHHIYISGQTGSPLRVRHFVSTNFANLLTHIALKFLDALAQLCAQLPAFTAMNALNDTSTCATYRTRNTLAQGTTLAYAKRLGLRHHIELMSTLA